MKRLTLLLILITGCTSKPEQTANISELMTLLTPPETNSETIIPPIVEIQTEPHLFLDNVDIGYYDETTNKINLNGYDIDLLLADKPYLYSDEFVQIYFSDDICEGQMFVLDLNYDGPIVSNYYFYHSSPSQYPLYIVDYNWPVQNTTIHSYMDSGICRPVTWEHDFRMLFSANIDTIGLDIKQFITYEIKDVEI